MTITSPLNPRHQEADASFAPYGPPEKGVLLVETFGQLEIEYAALRKSAVLLDLPHRAVLSISGADRIEFLNRMLTQELVGFSSGQVRRSFWLNRQGRIDADATLIQFDDQTWVELDVHSADLLVQTLSEYLFAEDVAIEDVTRGRHRLSLHGPDAIALLGSIADEDSRGAISNVEVDQAVQVVLSGIACALYRHDTTGEVGLELIAPIDDAPAVYGALAELEGVCPAGWHAYNIARIEAGVPLYNLDFGPDSLVHETGVIGDRVSFTKGCYLGQEIVARMEARGKPKRQLVALRLDPVEGETPQPVTGTPIHPEDDPGGDVVGAVTSSAFSPMLGAEPILFAMIKFNRSTPGTRLSMVAEGRPTLATVQDSLVFWKHE